jgi:hypothetical protein
MKSIQIAGDIQIDDIPFFQLAIIRDSMTNYFVDTCAATLWETVVVEGRWVCATFDRFGVDNVVDFIGCDTGSDGCSSNVEYFTCDPTCSSHLEDLFGGLDFDDPGEETSLCLGLFLG